MAGSAYAPLPAFDPRYRAIGCAAQPGHGIGAERTGDAVGGLLNATLGNLTELVIALTALQAGQYLLVKASIAGAIVTNMLFMLGGSFLLGGLGHHVQEFNRVNVRLQATLMFLATVALIVPSAIGEADRSPTTGFAQQLSAGIAGILIVAYGLGMAFSLGTHRELFSSPPHEEGEGTPWPLATSMVTLAVVTLLVALVSEIFVASVQMAAADLGMTPAFVGFVVVALVGGAAEMITAFSAARKDRLDLSVGIALLPLRHLQVMLEEVRQQAGSRHVRDRASREVSPDLLGQFAAEVAKPGCGALFSVHQQKAASAELLEGSKVEILQPRQAIPAACLVPALVEAHRAALLASPELPPQRDAREALASGSHRC